MALASRDGLRNVVYLKMTDVCAPIKLRSDLILSQHDGPAGKALVVKDPLTGRFFRFRETEGSLLQQFDGESSLNLLQEKLEWQLGVGLSLASLEQFVGKLRNLGLLEGTEAHLVSARRPRRRIQGNPFYLRWRA